MGPLVCGRTVVMIIWISIWSYGGIIGALVIRGKSAFDPCNSEISLTGYKVITCTEEAIGNEIPEIILDGWEVNEFIFDAPIAECKSKNFAGLKSLDRVNLTLMNVEFKSFSFACFQQSAAMFEMVHLKGSPRQLSIEFDFDIYFHDIFNVRLLTIDSIRVSNIPKSIYKTGAIPILERLVLRNTQLTRIDANAFAATQLKEIVFDQQDPPRINGFLVTIDGWLRPIANLEVLRFRNIPLPISSSKIFLLNLDRVLRNKLRVLEFDNCELNDISKTHHGLSLTSSSGYTASLEELILINNPIESYIEKDWLTGLQMMGKLRLLNITSNKLPLVQPFPNWMRRYESFPFSEMISRNNVIENVPSLSLPVKTQKIDFTGSRIIKASSSWSRNCNQLTSISLERINLERIVVDGITNNWGKLLVESSKILEEINLRSTGLRSDDYSKNIPVTQNFDGLKSLDLSNNSIASFVKSFHRLPETMSATIATKVNRIALNLADNRIERIDECEFLDDLGFEPLDIINLAGNPLICDCRLAWLQMIIYRKKMNVNCGISDQSIFTTNQLYMDNLRGQCSNIKCDAISDDEDTNGLGDDPDENFIRIIKPLITKEDGRVITIKLDREKVDNLLDNGNKGYQEAGFNPRELLRKLKDQPAGYFWLVTWSKLRPEKELQYFREIPKRQIEIKNQVPLAEAPLMLMIYRDGDYHVKKLTLTEALSLGDESWSTTTTTIGPGSAQKNGAEGWSQSFMIGLTLGSVACLLLLFAIVAILFYKLKQKWKRQKTSKTDDGIEDLAGRKGLIIDEKNFRRDIDMPQLPGTDNGEYVDSKRVSTGVKRVKSEEKDGDAIADDLYYDERTMRKSMLPGEFQANRNGRPLDDKYFETYGFLPKP